LSYISAQAAYEALKAVNGNAEDKEALQKALQNVNFTTPMGGKAYFDGKHAMVFDMIFLEARKANGECHIFEIGRLKNVKDPYDVFP
jgi:ABC-type branched-subunit amino acid transport system substrate-binding protein